MGVVDLLFGRPLASSEDAGERITPSQGVPTFGLDALSSAAYGPEAALTILLPLGLAGAHYVVPLTGAIIVLLLIVYFSYRQTIAAYPSGGGSYTVAKENLGPGAGLLAAAALMIDYLLNVAVGISAGIGALVSAVPWLQRYTLPMCLAVLAILTVVNLRGVREAGSAFIAPTYLFVGTLGVVIAIGIFKVIMTGGHPHALVPPPHAPVAAAGTVGLWLLLRAFASGCTALTGVEAVSNGVQAFREPVVPAARKTLTIIVLTLMACWVESRAWCTSTASRRPILDSRATRACCRWLPRRWLAGERCTVLRCFPSCWCFVFPRTPRLRTFPGCAAPSPWTTTCRTL